jgi:hypothetical protein
MLEIFSELPISILFPQDLQQGSPTRGTRAAYGPPDATVRLENISKTDKIINTDQAHIKAYLVNCGPQISVLLNSGPLSIFIRNVAIQSI